MCTETFRRLPAEKRGRFLEAAWGEFTRVKFADASINQIVRSAGIPRGSFYQYFTDKEELFHYLLEDIQAQVVRVFSELLHKNAGDLFQLQIALPCWSGASGCSKSTRASICKSFWAACCSRSFPPS